MADNKPDTRMLKLGAKLEEISGQFSTPRPSLPPLVETRGAGAATRGKMHEKSD